MYVCESGTRRWVGGLDGGMLAYHWPPEWLRVDMALAPLGSAIVAAGRM